MYSEEAPVQTLYSEEAPVQTLYSEEAPVQIPALFTKVELLGSQSNYNKWDFFHIMNLTYKYDHLCFMFKCLCLSVYI